MSVRASKIITLQYNITSITKQRFIMFSIFLFFLFMTFLLVFPAWAYKNVKLYPLWRFMATNEKGRRLAASLLSLVVIAFHLIYYSAFPNDMGIMLSTVYVFFSLSSKHNVRLLTFMRAHLKKFCYCLPLVIVLMCIPHMQPIAITLVCIFDTACMFPSNNMDAVESPELEQLGNLVTRHCDTYFGKYLCRIYEHYYEKAFTECYFKNNIDTTA